MEIHQVDQARQAAVAGQKSPDRARSYCSAAISEQRAHAFRNKSK
jgi:hypothetical protein